ncbi:MAG TPA: hypothetical protein VKP65_13390, partial [Rhodothermales bacterium]|nr:hypothetical protein [Rhodothermales bacterium]
MSSSEEQAQSTRQQDESDQDQDTSFFVDFKIAVVGGIIAVLFSLVGAFGVGSVSGAQAMILLEAMFPTTRFLCSAVMTASATILALMLTVLSLSQSFEKPLKPVHYRRIKQVALVTTIAFIASSITLLLHTIPLEQTESVPSTWYDVIYYVLLGTTAMLGGFMTTIILMLYRTVSQLIHVVSPHVSSSLLTKEEA